MRAENKKPELKSIGIFGANARIGRPMARFIAARSPSTTLRLIVRNDRHCAALNKEFPQAEVAVADYYDLPSLERALADIHGLFVVTPDFLDEQRAMTNLIYAARRNPGLLHIVRLLADPPGMTLERVPDVLKRFGGGTAIQHLRGKALLEVSGLPITYINIASYFMQNFLSPLFNATLRTHRTLAVPRNRRMGFIDTNDIAACGASILLSANHRHIGQTYHLNNGHDVMYFDELAELMSTAFGERIGYDGTDETFLRLAGDGMRAYFGRPDAAEYYLQYFQFEQDNETIWNQSNIVEYLVGRPAMRFKEWLIKHKSEILGVPG